MLEKNPASQIINKEKKDVKFSMWDEKIHDNCEWVNNEEQWLNLAIKLFIMFQKRKRQGIWKVLTSFRKDSIFGVGSWKSGPL